jgi:DNA-binding NtrC family response regulator
MCVERPLESEIVTDIKMPGMDGLELLAEIRTHWPDTPTLVITGHGEHDLVVVSSGRRNLGRISAERLRA